MKNDALIKSMAEAADLAALDTYEENGQFTEINVWEIEEFN